MCDVRTARRPGADILDPEQLAALTRWLEKQNRAQPGRHKFVVSPSLVVPFEREAVRDGPYREAYRPRSDGWDGYAGQLGEPMRCIAKRQIRKVVFLCGDAHRAMASRLGFERVGERLELGTACVVSSPLYARFPFANSRPEEYAEQGALELGEELTMRYELVEHRSLGRDGFSVVHADANAERPSLRVRFHQRGREAPEERRLPSVAAPLRAVRSPTRLPEHGFGGGEEALPPGAEPPEPRLGGDCS